MQHVIDIRCITLAVGSPGPHGEVGLLVRLEGLCGSLEITVCSPGTEAKILDVFFGPRGVLSSHSPRIEDVRELHIVGCFFGGGQDSHHIHTAMPNLVSISFFRCDGPHVFGLLDPTDPSSPPFPHLEHIMVFGSELGLIGMVKARTRHGVPLKTLVVGQGPGGFEYEHLRDLGELVGDLNVGCPVEILEWGTENEILNIWSTDETPGPVSPTGSWWY